VLYTLFDDLAQFTLKMIGKLRRQAPPDRGASELGISEIHS